VNGGSAVANDALDGGTGNNLPDVRRGTTNRVEGDCRAAPASDFRPRRRKRLAVPVAP
jgi:hypothetical protein